MLKVSLIYKNNINNLISDSNKLYCFSEENPHLESDYQLMMSSCNEVISAEVPNELREIARSINNPEEFMNLTDEEALKRLRDGKDESSKMFALFRKHVVRFT